MSNEEMARRNVLAVVQSATCPEELQRVLHDAQLGGACRLEPCARSPQGYTWFNVLVDAEDPARASRTVRNVLCGLLDAADRGLIEHFRIVSGAQWLRALEAPAKTLTVLGGDPWPT